MSNELVGLENVPNCYITRIVLNNNTTKSFICSVDLQLFDANEGDRTIWSYNSLFSNFLKVALIETKQPALALRLTQGLISPLPSNVRRDPFFNDNTKVYEVSVREFSEVNGAYMKKLVLKFQKIQKTCLCLPFVMLTQRRLATYCILT